MKSMRRCVKTTLEKLCKNPQEHVKQINEGNVNFIVELEYDENKGTPWEIPGKKVEVAIVPRHVLKCPDDKKSDEDL